MKLSMLFGPGRDEVWKKLSEEMEAEFIKNKWSGSKVVARFGNWQITLDIIIIPMGKMMIPVTRFRAPFQSRNGIRFCLFQQDIFQEIGKFFGMQDLETGDPVFDKTFIIQGNQPAKIISLFSVPEIRERLLAEKNIRLEIRDDEGWFGPDFPDDTDELYCQLGGEIRDPERLKSVFHLFYAILLELEKSGEAGMEGSSVELR